MYGLGTKANAEREAQKLVKLLGRGWKPRVWENMGWFASADRPPFTVYVESDRAATHKYNVMMGETAHECHMGTLRWRNDYYGSDPVKLVKQAYQSFVTWVAQQGLFFVHTKKIVDALPQRRSHGKADASRRKNRRG